MFAALLPSNDHDADHRNHCSSVAVTFVSVAAGTCLPNRSPETAQVYPAISRSLHNNGSTRYSIN
jgi:hypothetical protein